MQPLAALRRLLVWLWLAPALVACSPTYDWRQARPAPGAGIDFVVLLPGKPAHYTRTVGLGDLRVQMQMTAARAGDVSFVVASADVGDDARAAQALDAMRTALVANIAGRQSAPPILPGRTDGNTRTLDVDARGSAGARPQRLLVRLLARQGSVVQVMMLGDEKGFTDDNIETFFGSFKPS